MLGCRKKVISLSPFLWIAGPWHWVASDEALEGMEFSQSLLAGPSVDGEQEGY